MKLFDLARVRYQRVGSHFRNEDTCFGRVERQRCNMLDIAGRPGRRRNKSKTGSAKEKMQLAVSYGIGFRLRRESGAVKCVTYARDPKRRR